MAAYLIADVLLKNDEWVPEYAKHVHLIAEKHGGRYLSRSANIDVLEGKPLENTLIALIQFLLEMLSLVIQDHPEVLLVITGEGPAEAMLKKMTKDNGLQQNVMFLGYLDRAVGLNAAYRAADIFVFASKSETQGLVLLEAMAQETPVVAIAELGTASILRHEQGALIAQDDELHFAEQVQTLLIDHQLRERVGKNGKRYVEQVWSSEAQAKKLLECYERLMLANFPLSASAAA